MKSEKIRLYAIELSLVIFLLLANIFNNIFTRQITAIILLVFMVVSIKLIKNDKLGLTNTKQIIILLTSMAIIYVALIHILGIFIVFLLDYLDNKIKTPEDIEACIGIPVLGTVLYYETADNKKSKKNKRK